MDRLEEKIDDFCAEFGVPRENISLDETTGPNEFIVDDGVSEIPVVILAEDEIHEYALYLAGQTLFDDSGFVEKASSEADAAADPGKAFSIMNDYYLDEAVRLAKQPCAPYPNKLTEACVKNYVISDEDLDRYFGQGGAWCDSRAEKDLCRQYAGSRASQNTNRAITWLNEHWNPNDRFWKTAGRNAAADVKDFISRRGLIDVEKAAPIALMWNMKDKRCGTELDFIAQCCGEMKGAGEFFAFCDDWDAVRAIAASSIDDEL